jgi:uncharacterized membrane protein YfcA
MKKTGMGDRALEGEIYQLILVAAITLAASYIQSVAGFGFGIFAMVFFPYFLKYTEANVLSGILSTVTSVFLLVALFRKVHWKNLLFPILGSIVANYFAITFVKSTEQKWLVLLLGIALFCLSIYFFFFSDKVRIRPTWYAGLTAGVCSGVLSGLFSIGGPPVVIYYLQSEKDTDTYLATLSAYFILSGAVSISMKVAAGFVTETVLWGLLVGAVFMTAGSLLGRLTGARISPKQIKRAVYGIMAVSGAVNVVTALLP